MNPWLHWMSFWTGFILAGGMCPRPIVSHENEMARMRGWLEEVSPEDFDVASFVARLDNTRPEDFRRKV
jgi:hypothetical protein